MPRVSWSAVNNCCRRFPRKKIICRTLGPGLDAGLATLFAEEIYEAIRILEQPDFYLFSEDIIDKNSEKIWVGPANDIILRKRGVEFVDGSAPGFAAIVGSAPSVEEACALAHEYQTKNLYVFIAARDIEGKTSFAEQLIEGGMQIGWPTRLVPFGPEISGAVFALGFACRAAMAFGGIKPGAALKNLIYNKDRVFAFVNALSTIPDEWYANAAGAINWGFPTITTQDIPQVLPTGICTYEHVVSNVPFKEIGPKSIEVRGLKVVITEVPIPVAFGPAFEGEQASGKTNFAPSAAAARPWPWNGSPANAWTKWKTAKWNCSARTSTPSKKAAACPWQSWWKWPAVTSRPISSPFWNGKCTIWSTMSRASCTWASGTSPGTLRQGCGG